MQNSKIYLNRSLEHMYYLFSIL